jgi:hypothetical protein
MVPFRAEWLQRAARTRVALRRARSLAGGDESANLFSVLSAAMREEQVGELVPRHLSSPHGGLSTFGDLERGVPHATVRSTLRVSALPSRGQRGSVSSEP